MHMVFIYLQSLIGIELNHMHNITYKHTSGDPMLLTSAVHLPSPPPSRKYVLHMITHTDQNKFLPQSLPMSTPKLRVICLYGMYDYDSTSDLARFMHIREHQCYREHGYKTTHRLVD